MPHLNKNRLVLFVAILTATVGALVFKTPAALFLLATLICAPILASAIGRLMSRGLRVSRQMPTVASVGDELRARLTVRNVGPLPALLVCAQGRGADEPMGRAPWRQSKVEARLGDASEPFYEVVGEAELVVPILMSGQSFSGEIAWKLTRRGVYAWPGARVGTRDPVALSEPRCAWGAPAELTVWPRPLKLRRLHLSGSSPSARPLRRATASAETAEVHGVRPYQPGEGGRRIHWRATARTGQLHVVEWEEEAAADLTILLDVQAALIAGTPGQDSLEMAITSAASVAAFTLENGQRARIFWWANDPANADGAARLMRTESRHQAGLAHMLTDLAGIVPCHHSSATLPALSARVQRETGDEGALLLASDRANWNASLAPWLGGRGQVGARGLAFEAASFESADNAGFALRVGGAARATLQRASASKTAIKPPLPASVHRIKRDDSLVETLERNF